MIEGLILSFFRSEKLINIVIKVMDKVVKKFNMLLDKNVIFIIFMVCLLSLLLVVINKLVCFLFVL